MKKMAEISQPSTSTISITLSEKMDELVPPSQMEKGKKHLIIFDDAISLISQSTIETYFVKGRHHDINCIYISQSYFDLTRLIRLNTNFIILFKLNPRNLSDIYNSTLSSSMDKRAFLSITQNVFSKKYHYIAINKDTETIITDVFEDQHSDSDG